MFDGLHVLLERHVTVDIEYLLTSQGAIVRRDTYINNNGHGDGDDELLSSSSFGEDVRRGAFSPVVAIVPDVVSLDDDGSEGAYPNVEEEDTTPPPAIFSNLNILKQRRVPIVHEEWVEKSLAAGGIVATTYPLAVWDPTCFRDMEFTTSGITAKAIRDNVKHAARFFGGSYSRELRSTTTVVIVPNGDSTSTGTWQEGQQQTKSLKRQEADRRGILCEPLSWFEACITQGRRLPSTNPFVHMDDPADEEKRVKETAVVSPFMHLKLMENSTLSASRSPAVKRGATTDCAEDASSCHASSSVSPAAAAPATRRPLLASPKPLVQNDPFRIRSVLHQLQKAGRSSDLSAELNRLATENESLLEECLPVKRSRK